MICGMSSHCSLLKVNSHVLLTRPPLKLKTFIRLACVKHTASVHPEPGSNFFHHPIYILHGGLARPEFFLFEDGAIALGDNLALLP